MKTATSLTSYSLIERYSCPFQLSMKFYLLRNLKLLTTAKSYLLNIGEHENFFANKYENANIFMLS